MIAVLEGLLCAALFIAVSVLVHYAERPTVRRCIETIEAHERQRPHG